MFQFVDLNISYLYKIIILLFEIMYVKLVQPLSQKNATMVARQLKWFTFDQISSEQYSHLCLQITLLKNTFNK